MASELGFGPILSTVGSYWGPVGSFIGGTVGTYLDSLSLSSTTQTAQNLDLGQSTEGGPEIQIIGPLCRVRPQVIYTSKSTPASGGKLVTDVALAVASHPMAGIISIDEGIQRLMIGGVEVYNASGLITLVTDKVNLRFGTSFAGLQSLPDGPDLTRFKSGQTGENLVYMTGWDWPQNNTGSSASVPPEWATHSYITGDGQTWVRLNGWVATSQNPPVGYKKYVTEFASPGKFITITEAYRAHNTDYVREVRFHSGVAGQLTSSLVEKSFNSPPAFEGWAYVTLERFWFYNQMPEFECIVAEYPKPPNEPYGRSMSSSIDLLFERAGWGHDTDLQWDTSGIDDSKAVVTGYTMYDAQSLHTRINVLAHAYDFVSQVRDGHVYLFDPKDAREWTIPESDWGCGEVGSSGSGIKFSPLTDVHIPSKVVLHYTDSELSTFEDSAVERHIASDGPNTEEVMAIDFRNLVMSRDEATGIANRLIWRPRRRGNLFSSTLPSRWHFLAENDIVSTQRDGRTIRLVPTKITEGLNDVIHIEGFEYFEDPPRQS